MMSIQPNNPLSKPELDRTRRDDEGYPQQEPEATIPPLATLLEELRLTFTRFLFLQDGDEFILPLWVAFTHTLHNHRHSPRLFAWSPTYGCGKTLLMELLGNLVREPFACANPTLAVLLRTPEYKGHPTMLLDEADTWMGDAKSAITGVLNAGYGPRAQAFSHRVNLDKDLVAEFDLWAAVAIASRGRKVEGGMVRRSIQINMLKAPKGAEPERFIPEKHAQALGKLQGLIARWGRQSQVAAALKGADPKMPPALQEPDRWRPLFAIAELAGSEWVARLSTAVLGKAEGDVEFNVQLLRDIRKVFDRLNKPRLHTWVIVNILKDLEDAPWAEFLEKMKTEQAKARWIGAQIKAFGIKPEAEAWVDGGQRKRGYARAAFEEIWAQYAEHGSCVSTEAPVAPSVAA